MSRGWVLTVGTLSPCLTLTLFLKMSLARGTGTGGCDFQIRWPIVTILGPLWWCALMLFSILFHKQFPWLCWSYWLGRSLVTMAIWLATISSMGNTLFWCFCDCQGHRVLLCVTGTLSLAWLSHSSCLSALWAHFCPYNSMFWSCLSGLKGLVSSLWDQLQNSDFSVIFFYNIFSLTAVCPGPFTAS